MYISKAVFFIPMFYHLKYKPKLYVEKDQKTILLEKGACKMLVKLKLTSEGSPLEDWTP